MSGSSMMQCIDQRPLVTATGKTEILFWLNVFPANLGFNSPELSGSQGQLTVNQCSGVRPDCPSSSIFKYLLRKHMPNHVGLSGPTRGIYMYMTVFFQIFLAKSS